MTKSVIIQWTGKYIIFSMVSIMRISINMYLDLHILYIIFTYIIIIYINKCNSNKLGTIIY